MGEQYLWIKDLAVYLHPLILIKRSNFNLINVLCTQL